MRDVASERQKYVILTFMMDESTFRLHPNSETPQAGQGKVFRGQSVEGERGIVGNA